MKRLLAIHLIAACAISTWASAAFAHIVLPVGASTEGLKRSAALLDELGIQAAGGHNH